SVSSAKAVWISAWSMCRCNALRLSACEGRRACLSQGQACRSTSSSSPRSQAHTSVRLYIHPLRLKQPSLASTFRTCCCPAIPTLLLPRPPALFDVLVRLFQCAATRQRLQDLLRRGVGAGAEEGHPAVLLLHQHHPDQPPGRPPGRQERLDLLAHLFAVLHAA